MNVVENTSSDKERTGVGKSLVRAHLINGLIKCIPNGFPGDIQFQLYKQRDCIVQFIIPSKNISPVKNSFELCTPIKWNIFRRILSSWKPKICVKTRRNNNEIVIFRLYFKVIIELFQSQIILSVVKPYLGFSGWHYSEYVSFYIFSNCWLVLVFGLCTPVLSFLHKVSITRTLWKFNTSLYSL